MESDLVSLNGVPFSSTNNNSVATNIHCVYSLRLCQRSNAFVARTSVPQAHCFVPASSHEQILHRKVKKNIWRKEES